ncbi:alkaline phosphatase D family protein [Horticoccus luteus]|uniref:Alkaline phosphatase D family protein n=1 Tax=Horticoccus luteus TaxID=2862869 RepID=A0A8F9XJD3_9BACT|nr:alkaline phosphatase D family protein [Horticoccus luteus]QYM78548.1 alkaline phosphatase D family protein [Horticoccus luteus]
MSTDSAIIWTRLTRNAERVMNGVAFRTRAEIEKDNAPPKNETYEERALRISAPIPENLQLAGHALAEMDGAVPGAEGEVRIVYWAEGDKAETALAWAAISADRDFSHQFALHGLRANCRYRFRAEGRASAAGPTCAQEGSFRTAPAKEAVEPVTFTVVTGQDYARRDDPLNGHKTYRLMAELHPNFFVHTGDCEYYDKPTPLATTPALARFKWDRMYAMPYIRAFHLHVPSYFMKDDHDTLKDDAWPGQTYGELTFADGVRIFREEVPMGEKTYRTARWGKDLQVWMMEGREFRSPNTAPDGPDKTIWGPEQKAWFFRTVQESDATFRILIAPTPVVGPDREAKGDNHANAAFAHEGAELRAFLAAQKNMVVIAGDRHWQYVSADPATGLREYSTGPTSDAHAGGYSLADRTPMHRFLRIKGGFLHVTIERVDGQPRAVFRHYGTDGKVYNEDVVTAEAR